jgi:NAD(P)-dependent dehydrogenase (short-subunit alcohol dehydrogenase family)
VLLANKVALITGGGRGVGRSVAVAYAEQGARVVIVSRTVTELAKTERMIHDVGGQVLTIPMDLADDASINELRDRVLTEYGRLDILVNNAAVMWFRDFPDLTPEDWDACFSVNLRAPFMLARAFWQAMVKAGGGSIINVSSHSSVSGWRDEIDYCAAKHGLDGFTRALAVYAYPYNIAVNALHTGFVKLKKTSVTDEQFAALPPEARARVADSSFITPAFVYLAMQDGKGVTGRRLKAAELTCRIQVEGWNIKFPTVAFVPDADGKPEGLVMDPAEI